MTGITVTLLVKYVINVPQKDIRDRLDQQIKDDPSDDAMAVQAAEDLAKIAIEEGKETPIEFEVKEVS